MASYLVKASSKQLVFEITVNFDVLAEFPATEEFPDGKVEIYFFPDLPHILKLEDAEEKIKTHAYVIALEFGFNVDENSISLDRNKVVIPKKKKI